MEKIVQELGVDVWDRVKKDDGCCMKALDT